MFPAGRAARAVGLALSGTFTNAGQSCVGIERIYVDRKVYDEFLRRLVPHVGTLRLGASYDDVDVDLGSLTSAQQLRRVSGHVEDAVAKGATVETGGKARPDLGPYFYEPTVLTGVTPEMACHAEETFGPVVAVYPVAGAVVRANDTVYGLNASVFTRDARRGARVRPGCASGW